MRKKKWLVGGAAVIVAMGCFGVVHFKGLSGEVATQIFIGIASAIFPPAIAAISLGIVGHPQLSQRIGRNESFNHAGNVTFALLAGAVGTWVAQSWIFYASALIATGTVCSGLAIRSGDIDNLVARGAEGREAERGSVHLTSFSDL